MHCSNSNIGGWDYLSFRRDTCPSGVTGVMVYAAVMMISGGDSSGSRWIMVLVSHEEANEESFDTSYSQSDFGDDSGSGTPSYSLSLWYKLV